MTSITQDMKYRLSLILYAEKIWRDESCDQIQNQPSGIFIAGNVGSTAL